MQYVFRVAPLVAAIAVAASAPRAWAQVDVSGEWASTFHEDLPHRGGMRLGDFTGLPLNEAGQRKAESWDESARSLPERQCIPHVVTYALRGPATIRFSKVVDVDSGRLLAYSLVGSYGRPRTIWMDGREHPSDLAPHKWAGFSTGKWNRNTLVVSTTHIKTGWLQRNGAPTSDLATMTEFFTRYGDNLLVVTFVNDPVFLSEPFIRSTNFVASPASNANAWGHCGPAQIVDELPGRAKGDVPHYLPGQRQHIDDFLKDTGVPAEGARGGAETIYPEFAARLRAGTAADPAAAAASPPAAANGRGDTTSAGAAEIRVVPVQGNVYLLEGAGGNIVAQVGKDGVLLVDAGIGTLTDAVSAAVRTLSDQPIRFILNTHAHLDHVGGNEALAKSGAPAGGGLVVAGPAASAAGIIAHEAVLYALSAPTGEPSVLPVGAWPTDAYPGDVKEVFSNGEAIQLLHQPAAHTNGDSLVFFRRSDVVVTGDIFDLTRYPVIDVKSGGTFRGIVDGLNRIIDLTIPEDWQEGGTMVIPGHGRIADEADVVEYRDAMTIIRDRIQGMIARGMTLEQVKAARPTFEYDGRYGHTTGDWTTGMFVEAAYRDLAGAAR
jgi:glyoxylase-like metal-dependent hydrolase (beta-lactamase superfamily II)